MRRNPSQFTAGPRGRGTTHRLRTIVHGAALLVAVLVAVAATAAAATLAPALTVVGVATLVAGTGVVRTVRKRRARRSDRRREVCIPRTGTCVEV